MESSKRVLAVQQHTDFDASLPSSSRIAKFQKALEADLVRTAKREAGPSGGGATRFRRRGRDHRRGGSGRGAGKAHADKWLVGQGCRDEQLWFLGGCDT